MVVSQRGFLGAVGAMLILACKGSATKPKPPRKFTQAEDLNIWADLSFSSRISSFRDKDFFPHIHYSSEDFSEVDELKELRNNFLALLDEIQKYQKKHNQHTLIATYKSLIEFINKQKITPSEYFKEVKPEWLDNPDYYMDCQKCKVIINRAIDQCCIVIKTWVNKRQLFVEKRNLLITALSQPA